MKGADMKAAQRNHQQQAQAHREAARYSQMAAEHCERAAQAYERGDAQEGQWPAGGSERHMDEARNVIQKLTQQF